MNKDTNRILNRLSESIIKYSDFYAATLLLVNFLVRVVVYRTTNLFHFSDYKAYLEAVEKLQEGEKVYLLNGNFLYAISYLGYFATKLGSLDLFFIFNYLVGTITGLLIYILLKKVTSSPSAGLISLFLLTIYTEYIVFSSVFYTPIIMIFLVSLLLLSLWYYITSESAGRMIFSGLMVVIIFLVTFFFKPELKYFPWFLMVFAVGFYFFIKKKEVFLKLFSLPIIMILFYSGFNNSGILTHPPGNIIANDFVFFGHTDYGGDGGEGAFIYHENMERYEKALADYCEVNGITNPGIKEINKFQMTEVKKFICGHPLKWAAIQLTKFFRTFGVIPESASFRILYTGLLKGKTWLTAGVVAFPVVFLIVMLIMFFDYRLLVNLFIRYKKEDSEAGILNRNVFLYVYLIMFFYYLVATIFYGHYQERYRMPVMTLFIIPVLSYFIAYFNKKEFLRKGPLIVKGIITVLFLVSWSLQIYHASERKVRYWKAIEESEHIITGESLNK